MARPQKRKRQQADGSQPHRISSKKTKSSRLCRSLSNFPPAFYDNLSKVWLTHRSKRELDRRNDHHPPPKPIPAPTRIGNLDQAARKAGPELARFARAGGPNLCDLRGYPGPISVAMSPTSSASSKWTRSTKATTVSSKSRRSSAYDANFDQHLIDHNIYPPFYDFPDDRTPPKPANLEEIRQVLAVPRASLSPSVVPGSAFGDFQRKNKTKSEGTVMRNVVPLLAGNSSIPNEGHLPFTNLDSITENTTVNPVPDFFDGARPGAVDKRVREDLDRIIVPTKKAEVPVAPNFSLEAKGPGGTADVAQGQAVLDGAHGALMMYVLQNYLKEEPVYDGNAYTFTSTYLDGQLKLYAHYLTAPPRPGQRPDFHTTQLDAYALTGNDKGWLEGTAALRSLRTLAKGYRDRFIEAANSRARNRSTDATAANITLIPSVSPSYHAVLPLLHPPGNTRSVDQSSGRLHDLNSLHQAFYA